MRSSLILDLIYNGNNRLCDQNTWQILLEKTSFMFYFWGLSPVRVFGFMLQRIPGMVGQFQGRNNMAEGCGRAKLLSSWPQKSRERKGQGEDEPFQGMPH